MVYKCHILYYKRSTSAFAVGVNFQLFSLENTKDDFNHFQWGYLDSPAQEVNIIIFCRRVPFSRWTTKLQKRWLDISVSWIREKCTAQRIVIFGDVLSRHVRKLQIEYDSEVHICKRNCGSSETYINHTLMSIFGGKCIFNIAKIHNFKDLE